MEKYVSFKKSIQNKITSSLKISYIKFKSTPQRSDTQCVLQDDVLRTIGHLKTLYHRKTFLGFNIWQYFHLNN